MNDPVKQVLAAKVYDVAIKTPLHHAAKLSRATGNHIYLKREDLQPVHSFKIRGAYNKIVQLTKSEKLEGIVAASAGNHAQGVALSAKTLGYSATIYMPKTTPAIKIEAVRAHGAKIVLEGDNYTEAYEACLIQNKGSNKTFIHPFDDESVIAGQGTIGMELLDQLPHAEYIFIPIGGGGLAAGIAQYVKHLRPDIKIIGVEPVDSNAMQASLAAGKRVILDHVGVFADGVAVKSVGDLTFKLCIKYLDGVITVSNDQICAAIKSIFEDTRSIVEPAGALSLAGALEYLEANRIMGKHIITISSGANIPFEKLQYVAERTLLGSGKEALFEITLPEVPGALAELCDKAVTGHGITEFSYRISSREKAHIFVGISISGDSDKNSFMESLRTNGYQFHDLSTDDVAKEHVRYMIGGTAPRIKMERLYQINFPERPGALKDFLAFLGTQFNISLFHYRGQGGDTGRVMIGFETSDVDALEKMVSGSHYDFVAVNSRAADIFVNGDKITV